MEMKVRRRISETADWVKQSRHPFIGVSESTHSANANTVHEIGLASRSLLSLNSHESGRIFLIEEN
jgi:hypothetical protein